MKLLSYENMKLKEQFIFNLPATKQVCGRMCPGCYATKPQKRFPSVLASRETKLKASESPTFVNEILGELSRSRRTARTVRIHESGEFYSQTYLDKWEAIAKTKPDFTFYAFTKRKKDFDFSSFESLPNVVIIDSLMHGGLNYAKAEDLSPSIFTCPSTEGKDVVCGVSCRYCMTKEAQSKGVQFVRH